ncbi:acetyl-CoA hydrolase/transferase C-terminal domain-containing protein [Microbaculum marinum]|uniref:Acetyl-CoA hydrolase/transferase C-terminal domain-containing protein n=1 Tax=Microbaculum marinum TaxID=1764581 RepID=A0AAW9RU43_9HYPH
MADAILAEVGRTIVLALPLGLGKANHIANALYARAKADPGISLTIITALSLEKPFGGNLLARRFMDPIIERLFGGYPDLAYVKGLRDGSIPDNIQVIEFFLMAGQWLGIDRMQQNYIPANYTHAARYAIERGINVVAQLVATDPGQTSRYSLSCNTDVTLDLLAERDAGRVDFTMVGQTNSALPYMQGEAEIMADRFAHMLDGPDTDFPLFAPPNRPVGLAEHAAGINAARLVPDGGTLQIGIGSIGDGLTNSLVLRHRDNGAFVDLASKLGPATPLDRTERFETGLYGLSEMFVPGFLELARAGILKREVDGALLDAAFFLGPRSFYEELRDMPPDRRAKFRMRGVSYVNEFYGDEAAKLRARAGARFVNNAMMVTLLGSVVSDGLDTGQVVSGVGGQYNFVAQAFALPDARSIITLPATRRTKGKPVSNILWSYANSTVPRHLRDIVVTEYGVADLRGTTDAEAIARLLAITDSRFQEDLLEKAKSAGKIGRDYELPAERRGNTPERIDAALAPARAAGLLPAFPFGTDFDETEQRLLPALDRLRNAQNSYVDLARLLLAGLAASDSPERAACLERMGLGAPTTWTERLYARLLTGALACS